MNTAQKLVVLGGGKTYQKKIISLFGAANIVRYWPMNETTGTAAVDVVNGGNGTYTGVDLANAAGPFPPSSHPLFGTGDRLNVYGAALNTAFPGNEGTLLVWCKVSAAGIWSDGATHRVANFQTSGNPWVTMLKTATNKLQTYRRGNDGTAAGLATISTTTTDWFYFGQTWSASNNRQRSYLNGAQQGADQAGVTAWGNSLNANLTNIGALNNVPDAPWSGWLGHAILLNYEATAAQILKAYTG
jgi:hypothetical protein